MNVVSKAPRRTVLSYGTFDLSHPSENQHLRDLCALGDELILGCATDAFADLYGFETTADYAQRRDMLESCRYVDRVIAQQTTGQIRTDIVNYNVCIFAMGAEWNGFFDDLQDIAQVVYLPHNPARIIVPSKPVLNLKKFQLAV